MGAACSTGGQRRSLEVAVLPSSSSSKAVPAEKSVEKEMENCENKKMMNKKKKKKKKKKNGSWMGFMVARQGPPPLRQMSSNGSNEVACLFTQQGRKGINQDAMVVVEDFSFAEETVFCGVFDGHGPFGHLVAQTVRDRLPSKLLSHCKELKNSTAFNSHGDLALPSGGTSNSSPPRTFGDVEAPAMSNNSPGDTPSFLLWKESFLQAFEAMDKDLKDSPNLNCICSGTTAITLVKQGRDMFIGNVGDSRAILVTQSDNDKSIAVQLTVDLKPNLPQEAERIQELDGRIFALTDEPDVYRVWLPSGDSPGLAMARAFGDFCLKKYGVIAVPEVTHRRLTERDQFIVLATDGVWDVLSNDEVAGIVSSVSSRSLAAKSVVESAVQSWQAKYPNSKIDDCAVVCLFIDSLMDSGPATKEEETLNKGSLERQLPAPNIAPHSGGVDGHKAECIALEGVARANSLVGLPRFTVGDQKAGG